MKNQNPISFLGLALAFVFSTSLIAQDKTEVSVQIKKEGKVIMDTTYQYNDDAEAKHAVKMMEIISEDCNHSKEMVFISEEELDGDNVKVIKKKIMTGEHQHEEIEVNKIIEEHGDGENVEVIVIKKKIKKKPIEQ